jgi:hypothetical protein
MPTLVRPPWEMHCDCGAICTIEHRGWFSFSVCWYCREGWFVWIGDGKGPFRATRWA